MTAVPAAIHLVPSQTRKQSANSEAGLSIIHGHCGETPHLLKDP